MDKNTESPGEGRSPRFYEVVTTIEGAHPLHTDYPLLPGDVLTRQKDGTFTKVAPGLGIFGFALTQEECDSLVGRTHLGRVEMGGLAEYAEWCFGG